MATTIARLSAVLTTDTGQFQQGFDRASQTVRRFQANTEGGGGSLAQMAKELAHLQHGAEKSSGSLLKLGAFGLSGGLVGLGFLMAVLAKRAIEAAVAFDEARRKIVADINEMRKAANAGTIDANKMFGPGLAEEWGALKKDVFGGLGGGRGPAERLAESLQVVLRETRGNVKEFKEFWGISTGPAAKTTLEKLEELKAKTAAWLAEQKKLRDEEAKAIEARNKEFERLKNSAESIARSLRTPAEVWRDSIDEIGKLTQLGLLSLEQYGRGVERANEDLKNANKAADKIRSSTAAPGTPAANRFSPQAFSAIQAAARAETARLEIEKAQLAVEKQQQKELERVNQQLSTKPLTSIKVGRLN